MQHNTEFKGVGGSDILPFWHGVKRMGNMFEERSLKVGEAKCQQQRGNVWGWIREPDIFDTRPSAFPRCLRIDHSSEYHGWMQDCLSTRYTAARLSAYPAKHHPK